MILHVKFITVSGRCAQGDREVIGRYLYDHTRIVEWTESGKWFVGVLRTEARTDKHAQYLADYQAGRLQSGLFRAVVTDDAPTHEAMALAVPG